MLNILTKKKKITFIGKIIFKIETFFFLLINFSFSGNESNFLYNK